MCIFTNIFRCLCNKQPKLEQTVEIFTIKERNPYMYAVPVELLPPNFDFNQIGVTNLRDHVLVSDLTVINRPMIEEYQQPLPYNPNF